MRSIDWSSDVCSSDLDSWIVGELRNKILFDREVRSINYSIDSVAGTIYLMGIGQSEKEVLRVIDHARDVPYVRRVVSYVQQIGRASCRDRVCLYVSISVVALSLKKKKNNIKRI